MRRRRFFRILWNFNALVIAVLGVLALAILAPAAFERYRDYARPGGAVSLDPVAAKGASEEELVFGDHATAKGWETLRIPLELRRTAPSAGREPVVVATRNYLFHDLTAAEGRWLFPTHGQVILRHRPLTVAGGGEGQDFDLALHFEIVRDDTNGDGRLGGGDRIVVALTLPDGQGYTEVIRDADRVIGTQAISDDELLVLYQQADSAYAARISLPGFELLSTRTLAGAGPVE